MAIVLYISTILLSIGVMMLSWGYNLTLPYYTRRKILEGINFSSQWNRRRLRGRRFIKAGIVVIAMSVLLGFGIMGFFIANTYKCFSPTTVEVHQTENYTLLIINEVEHKVDKNIYCWIDKDYPGMTMKNRHNIYGIEIYSDEFVIMDILPEEDKRFLEADDDD